MSAHEKTETTKDFINLKAIFFFIIGFVLASICWHFGGVDYSDRNAASGLAMVLSMLIGAMGFLAGMRV